jgi:multicomponent Na+:H+ antiporter subunit E
MIAERPRERGAARPTQLLGLFLILMLSWVLWSGLYKPLLLWLGLFSCLLTLWMAERMGFFRPAMSLHALLRLPRYWGWLLQEVVKSSLQVARVVLTPSLPISPTLVELRTTEITEAGKVILGNAITLSPGTVTIDMHEDQLLVHCLNERCAEELLTGEVQRRTAGLGLR